MENLVSPQQAIANLNEVAAQHKGTRSDHEILTASVEILVDSINELNALREKVKELEEAAGIKPVVQLPKKTKNK